MLTYTDKSEDPELLEGSAWITVGNISVYIVKHQDEVVVELLKVGSECCSPISKASAPISKGLFT